LAPPIAGWRLLAAFGAAVAGGVRLSAQTSPLRAFAVGAGRSARDHAAKREAGLLAAIASLARAGAAKSSWSWRARNGQGRAGQAGDHARLLALDDAGRADCRAMSRGRGEPQGTVRQEAVLA
jgi:hypothetical protein